MACIFVYKKEKTYQVGCICTQIYTHVGVDGASVWDDEKALEMMDGCDGRAWRMCLMPPQCELKKQLKQENLCKFQQNKKNIIDLYLDGYIHQKYYPQLIQEELGRGGWEDVTYFPLGSLLCYLQL